MEPAPLTSLDPDAPTEGLEGVTGLAEVESLLVRLAVGGRFGRASVMLHEHLSSGGKRTRGNNCLRQNGDFLTPGKQKTSSDPPSCDHGTAIYLVGATPVCADVGVLPTGSTVSECASKNLLQNITSWSGVCVNWRYVTRDHRWTMVRFPSSQKSLKQAGWAFIKTSALDPDRRNWPTYYERGTC